MGKIKEVVANVKCRFGALSITNKTGTLPIAIDRGELDVVLAADILCGRRLYGRLVLTPDDEDADQTSFFDAGRHKQIDGVFDVTSFGCKPSVLTASLKIALADVAAEELLSFRSGRGRLIVDNMTSLDSKAPAAEEIEDAEEDVEAEMDDDDASDGD